MRAGAQRIATARGEMPEMPGSRAGSRAWRSSKIGAALACRIPTRPSGGAPRASFSTAWSCAMRAMASSPARPCRSACPGGGHGRPSPCGRGALWTGSPVDGEPCGRGALWTGSPVAPPVRDPWRTDLRRTCRARRCIARRCHGRAPASRPPRPAPRTDRSLRARLRTLADVAGAGEVTEPGMADRCPFRDPACARIPRGAHPSTIPCASGPGPGRPRSMGRDGRAACAKVSQPGHAKRGRTMRSTTDRPFDGPTVPPDRSPSRLAALRLFARPSSLDRRQRCSDRRQRCPDRWRIRWRPDMGSPSSPERRSVPPRWLQSSSPVVGPTSIRGIRSGIGRRLGTSSGTSGRRSCAVVPATGIPLASGASRSCPMVCEDVPDRWPRRPAGWCRSLFPPGQWISIACDFTCRRQEGRGPAQIVRVVHCPAGDRAAICREGGRDRAVSSRPEHGETWAPRGSRMRLRNRSIPPRAAPHRAAGPASPASGGNAPPGPLPFPPHPPEASPTVRPSGRPCPPRPRAGRRGGSVDLPVEGPPAERPSPGTWRTGTRPGPPRPPSGTVLRNALPGGGTGYRAALSREGVDLDRIAAPAADVDHVAGERVLLQRLPGLRGQRRGPAPHVGHARPPEDLQPIASRSPGRGPDPHGRRDRDHGDRPRIGRVGTSGSQAPKIRSRGPPATSISIVPGAALGSTAARCSSLRSRSTIPTARKPGPSGTRTSTAGSWGGAVTAMCSSGMRRADHRSGLSGSGGFETARCQRVLGVQVAEALRGSTARQNAVDHEAENRRLKRDLARVTEERDTLE